MRWTRENGTTDQGNGATKNDARAEATTNMVTNKRGSDRPLSSEDWLSMAQSGSTVIFFPSYVHTFLVGVMDTQPHEHQRQNTTTP